jgi:ketosteroid isomerase-like protein
MNVGEAVGLFPGEPEGGLMHAQDRLQTVREDFTFYSPPDPGIDRAAYFERCWPNAGHLERFDFVRLIEAGDEVIATCEATRTDGQRFRNTEIHTFNGNRISRVEVYFGWDLP